MENVKTPGGPGSRGLEPDRPKTEEPAPLGVAHTPNFPELLRLLGASLLVTKYQTGKLVMVRDEGNHLNTYFRGFDAPTSVALAGDRLAIGKLVHRARRGAGRRAGVATGAGRTDPWRGGVGREQHRAAHSVRDGVRSVFLDRRLFNTRGATEPCVDTERAIRAIAVLGRPSDDNGGGCGRR